VIRHKLGEIIPRGFARGKAPAMEPLDRRV
jgi:hypothetical protein